MAAVGSGWVDWGRSIAYVDHNGSELDRARLRGILGRPQPDAKVIRGLEARQREDGGFPYGFVQGRPSAITSTAAALAWLDDLGLLGSVHAERAFMFLLAVQRPEGSWDEPPALFRYGPPPYLVPGDLRVRVASTALVGYWLARAGERDDPVTRAAAYLRAHQAPNGRFVGFLSTTWLAAALFHMVEGPTSAPAASGFEALAAVPPDHWRPGALAEALSALGDAGVGDDVAFVADGLRSLSAACQPDGSWVSEDGEAYHVEVTLTALHALLRYAAPPRGSQDAGDAAAGANSPAEGIAG
jgi:hypothetical protein